MTAEWSTHRRDKAAFINADVEPDSPPNEVQFFGLSHFPAVDFYAKIKHKNPKHKRVYMSTELPVQAQFEAYNAHDIEGFMACFSDEFKGYRMPSETPSLTGKESLRAFYTNNRFNNPELKAELISRLVLGNNVFDHELIYGLSDEALESVAVFEVKDGLISTAWFYFPQ